MQSSLLKTFLFIFIFTSVLFPQKRMAIVLPTELKEYDNTLNQKLIEDVHAFEIFLIQNKINYSVIFTEDLDNDLPDTYSLLIFPTNTNLDKNQFNSLKRGLELGSGIITFSEIKIIEDDSLKDFCKSIYGIETFTLESGNNSNLIVKFYPNPNYLFPFDSFELLIKSNRIKNIFRVNNKDVFSFGCLNNSGNLTTAFFGFKSNSRFAHFGFSLSDILSDKKTSEQFEKLLLKLFNWIEKNSGVWLTYNGSMGRNFISLVDLNKIQSVSINTIKSLIQKNFPALLISDNPEVLAKVPEEFISNCYYGLKLNCVSLKTDSILKALGRAQSKINFIIFDYDCLSEEDIKKFSFEGIETILIKDSEKSFYYPVPNILLVSYSDITSERCESDKVVVAEYPEKINCEKTNRGNLSEIIISKSEELKPFNRSEIINELMVNKLDLITKGKPNEQIILIENNNNVEVKNLLVLVDSKQLDTNIVYDIKIDGKSTFNVRDFKTGYYLIRLEKVSPKSKTEIKILFDNNS